MSAVVALSEMVAAKEFDDEYPNDGSSATWADDNADAVTASLIFE